ncbi:MAG: NYN domain-containing protein [Verrucomicrobiaceae bacterium]|nr:NYN domain-containing protein [Verrucomicrobiaceae bacterium]
MQSLLHLLGMGSAVFVDLSNFYSRLVRSGLGEPRELRDYFLHWLDLDLLSTWLTSEESPPTWVFYSGQKIGAKSERVEGDYLKQYIKRISRLKGVTPCDVQIPGDQREKFTVNCGGCGMETSGQWESEKGVDSSLIVHLFDTSSSWDEAMLLSGDADFIPAVRSLRRQGKRVSGAGFHGTSEALVREFHQFIDLSQELIRDDFAAYLLFGPHGVLSHWLLDPVAEDEVISGSDQVSLTCGWGVAASRALVGNAYSDRRLLNGGKLVDIVLQDSGMRDLARRLKPIEVFRNRFPEICNGSRKFALSAHTWRKVQRAIPELLRNFACEEFNPHGKITSTLMLDRQTGHFTRPPTADNAAGS